mmetsp:Transcript_25653/g.54781  ORF Transcript_25653/g.54781 Transcript_25653/m.54781 type:complete len:320 (-) Transcript_25653:200-1159(-)
MISATIASRTTSTTTGSRKRFRPRRQQKHLRSSPLLSVALVQFLVAIFFASFVVDARISSNHIQPEEHHHQQQQQQQQQHIDTVCEWEGECENEHDEDWEEEYYEYDDDDDDEDCEEYGDEDCEDESEEDDELEDEEDFYTEAQIDEMEALYERYLASLEETYGADWEEEYELVPDMETIYERYLEFNERKQQEKEQKEKIEESHRALRRHQKEGLVESGYYSLDDEDYDTDLWAPSSFPGDDFILQHDAFYLDREWADFNKVGGDESFQTKPRNIDGSNQTWIERTSNTASTRTVVTIPASGNNDKNSGEQQSVVGPM